MHTETVRLCLILPKDLVESLKKMVPPRTRSRFVAESLREYIKQKQNVELEKKLEEGYVVRAKETTTIVKDFEAADLEGWDEY